MDSSTRTKVTSAILITFLCACGYDRPPSAPPSYSYQDAWATDYPPPTLPSQRTGFHSIDAYKINVAEHIMRHNTAHTFSGQLPPMLPAIVVLRITVDRDGHMTKVFVQRSPDDEASSVALQSMQRSGLLPKPLNLVADRDDSITFMETFLFNDDYRFQLRSLAGPQ
jgi:periplasmic protein TonB